MPNLIQEFKKFAIKGNMVDLAIGVVIGASFNKVVDVIVKQIFMPPLSILTGGLNFSDKKIILKDAVVGADGKVVEEVIAIGYGQLIEVTLDFFIIALTVFLVVKFMNSLRDKAEDTTNVTVQTPKDIELLNRVAELLEKQNALLEKQLKN